VPAESHLYRKPVFQYEIRKLNERLFFEAQPVNEICGGKSPDALVEGERCADLKD
jgi:hypothetical protein